MRTDLTFTIVKPTAFEKNYTGPILEMFSRNGFNLCAMKLVHISREKAKEFYAEHEDKPFFESLIAYMTSGPVVVAVLQKKNAIADFREMIGSTDPANARFGTIRKMYADSKEANAVHGSDSDASAQREMAIFFSPEEIYA